MITDRPEYPEDAFGYGGPYLIHVRECEACHAAAVDGSDYCEACGAEVAAEEVAELAKYGRAA